MEDGSNLPHSQKRQDDKLICDNYKGIFLLCIASQIQTDILRERDTSYTQKYVRKYQ